MTDDSGSFFFFIMTIVTESIKTIERRGDIAKGPVSVTADWCDSFCSHQSDTRQGTAVDEVMLN